jgi:transmembrane sensor
VRLGSADTEVLVTHGKVEVGSAASLAPDPAAGASGRGAPPEPPPATLLVASERVLIPAARTAALVAAAVEAPRVEKVAPAAIREALAWQGPRLVFVDTPLAEVIAQFNRRNAVQIELAGPELGALPIGGSFRAENVDAFVRLLASSGDIAYERVSDHRVVLRSVR